MKQQENPWKGLDSYKETDRIYGRDEEIEELMSRIEYNVQTVLYSRSGIGKSSILNAGIFPKARLMGMLPVNIRLQHSTSKQNPGTPYITQIINAIQEELKAHDGTTEELVPRKEGHEESLWEHLHRQTFLVDGQRVTPLLVFDQFEEIFTLQKNPRLISDFFAQVADLLNGVMPDYLNPNEETTETEQAPKSQNIFKGIRQRIQSQAANYLKTDDFRLIFSLREDYLSYLERNTTRIPSMKLNRYCLLPINEEQAATIIMQPRPGLVSEDVAKLIIEKVTGESEIELDDVHTVAVDSAILSLYISRLYEMMPEDANEITEALVNKFSDNIIQDFYLDAISGIRNSTVEYLEDNLLNNEGRRENISIYNATHIGHVTDEELNLLCEKRRLIRRFYYGGDMRLEYIHDILCPVVKERRETRQLMKIQEEERRKLLEIEREKRARLEEKARADKQRYHRYIIAGSLLLLILLGSWLRRLYLDEWTCSEYYVMFSQVNGWPVGIGHKLSESEASKLSISYKLTKKGHRVNTPFTEVEVMSSDQELLHNNRRVPLVRLGEKRDRKARQFGDMLNETKYYRFSSTESGSDARVTKYEAINQQGKTLYIVTYFNSSSETSDESISLLWAVYTDAKGTPLQVRDNGADRMQIYLNAQGQEEKYMFFDENRAPKSNDLGCYGYRLSYNEWNETDTVWGLDPFCTEEYYELRTYSPTECHFSFYDLEGHPIAHPSLNYHHRIERNDGKGNLIEKIYLGSDDNPVSDTLRPARSTFIYDEFNRVQCADYFNAEGQPYSENKKYYARCEYTYIGHTQDLLSEADYRWDPATGEMNKVIDFFVLPFGSVTEYYFENLETGDYRMRRMEHNEEAEPVSISYYSRNDTPMFDSIEHFHKHIIERKQLKNGRKIVVHRFYDVDGALYSDISQGYYAIDSCVYSSNNLLLSRTCFDSDTMIVKSQGYEYNDGVEVTRYARGVHGTPIRCPQWERDGLCYYRLSSVKSSTDALSYVKPVSEYGGTSWAYEGSDPFGLSEKHLQQQTTNDMGSTWQKVSVTTIFADRVPQSAPWVMYVHLLKIGCPADQLGLKDGDLVIKVGGWEYSSTSSTNTAIQEWNKANTKPLDIQVARYNQSEKAWAFLTFQTTPGKANFGAEIYPVYYSSDEYNEFQKAWP